MLLEVRLNYFEMLTPACRSDARIPFSLLTTTLQFSESHERLGELPERDLPNVDRDQHRVRNLVLFVIESEDTSPHWNHDSVNVSIVVRVVHPPRSPHDVDYILMPAQQSVRPEIRDLLVAVTRDRRGKRRLEPAPLFSVLLPRGQFFRHDRRMSVEERDREVGPQRIAVKIGDVQIVPGRFV